MTSYDLTAQPWIRARRLDGSTAEFSLRETFAQAHELRTLAGDLATQDAAVLRLLLAIVHRAIAEQVRGHRPTKAWERLWAAERLPVNRIDEYLDRWRPRFDLFDEQRPFMQVAGLRTAKDEDFGLARLVADQPTGEPFFTTRAGRSLDSLRTAEAARWLVHCHAFDVSGIKSGAVGDPRVKGGKGYPIGCGWTGQIGLVVAQGATLRETLLLNLVLDGSDPGKPVWERASGQGPGVDEEHRAPRTVVDTLVWQSRRVRLVGDENQVTRVLICNGDPAPAPNMHTVETSTVWRRSPTQEKKLGLPLVYMPRTHDPERSMWRGLESLLGGAKSAESREAAKALPPGLIDWLAELRHDEILSQDYVVRLRAIGLRYGSNNSVVDEVIDDAVTLHAAVLANRDLRGAAIDAVTHADHAVYALRRLAEDLAHAAGGDPEGPRARASELGYYRLTEPFHRWLSALAEESEVSERLSSWDEAVRRTIGLVGADLVRQAGIPAFVGRAEEDAKGKLRVVDAGAAELDFQHRLRHALPYLTQEDTTHREAS